MVKGHEALKPSIYDRNRPTHQRAGLLDVSSRSSSPGGTGRSDNVRSVAIQIERAVSADVCEFLPTLNGARFSELELGSSHPRLPLLGLPPQRISPPRSLKI
ncbi:Hypothetical protein NTJ_05734 [Nesidiocoris tenuis]|uniref:Uncharacterized protein n=1 Tax=Nesidiocoris tenuis TaxID=355587 RepID=A0ABN7APV9_9HEMI|nr:Hypothetical protein NTJ_05734 [Nesidiocoris tenuis]